MATLVRLQPFRASKLAVFAVVALLSTTCFAGTWTAYGPRTYSRATGSPVTVSDTFIILNPNTQYTLRVHNGGLVDAPTDFVSSTTIVVNGITVVAPNDLNQNISEVDRLVTLLAGSNEIDVQVRGAPGGSLAVDIIGVDNDLPVISAAQNPLANPGGWNNTDVVVTFTCTDATSGVANCTSPVTLSSEGANQVTSGQAADKAGNTASTSLTLSIDKTPPVITATANPAPNANGWNNTDVTITYQCSDALSGVAFCPDPALVNTEGAGEQITQAATDRATNQATATKTINLDKTAPVLSITSPAAGAVVNASTITLTGTVADSISGVALVKCGSTIATVTGGSFTCSETMAVGTNSLEIQATDIAGNTGSATTSVAFVRPPQIIITSPTDSALFNQSPINVTGTIVDPAGQVQVNGIAAPVSGNTFLATVPAQEGISTITAVVVNTD